MSSRRPLLRACTAGIVLGLFFFLLLSQLRAETHLLKVLRVVVDPISKLSLQTQRFYQERLQPFLRTPELRREIQALRQATAQLSQDNARLYELRAENRSLREALNFREEQDRPVVVARISGKLHENNATFFTLNKGENHGIVAGAPVLANNTLVGKVVKARDNWSTAISVTAPQVKTAATLAGQPATAGILEGELNLGAVLKFIPNDVVVQPQMPIITSGLESNIPRGLLIGLVERVESSAQELFQTAYVKTTSQLGEAFVVSVIINAPL